MPLDSGGGRRSGDRSDEYALQGPHGPQGPAGVTGPAGPARAWGESSDFHNALINGPAAGVTFERVQMSSYCVKVEG